MIVKVDFYSLTGKWKYGGEVDVGPARLWNGDFLDAIMKNQRIISHSGPVDLFVVCSNANPESDEFANSLYTPDKLNNWIFRNK